MSDDLVKRLRDSTEWYHYDAELKMKCADRIEELEADNKGLRHMILDQINSTGDDPEIMAATRAEWAARAKAAEDRLENAIVLIEDMLEWGPWHGETLVEILQRFAGVKGEK